MAYVKITGYLEVDDNELDESSSTGLTAEAYKKYTVKQSIAIDDLEDIDVEPDDRDNDGDPAHVETGRRRRGAIRRLILEDRADFLEGEARQLRGDDA
jgi:hypothetical protein